MKAIGKRVKALEKSCVNESRLAYLSKLRLDIDDAQALDVILSRPEEEVSYHLETLSNETIAALQNGLREYLSTEGMES